MHRARQFSTVLGTVLPKLQFREVLNYKQAHYDSSDLLAVDLNIAVDLVRDLGLSLLFVKRIDKTARFPWNEPPQQRSRWQRPKQQVKLYNTAFTGVVRKK